KIFICRYETEKIKEIIRTAHTLDHFIPRGTYDNFCNTYCGVFYEDVIDYILICENCSRERNFPSNNSITPIIPSYQRERLFVDTIDMSVYSDHNNGFNFIFTFLDYFSKFDWAYQQKEKTPQFL
ncbi:hypothetical protein DMUE_0758, partial [Dictyocoela muelleri]